MSLVRYATTELTENKMKKTFNIAKTTMLAVPLALASGMALAGGLSEPIAAPAPAPVIAPAPVMRGSDWTGFYAGGQIGFGRLDSSSILDDDDPTGALYGVHAGYMYDLGTLVLGAELDIDGTSIESDIPAVEVDSVARLKARLGYDAGQYMPYITAGGARVMTSGALDGETDGTFAGLGLAYKFNDSIMFGGEVLQHQFEDVVVDGVDVDATTLTARVSFQF